MPTTVVVDVYLTRARVVANWPGSGDDRDEFLDLADGPITLRTSSTGFPTLMYPVEYEGFPADGFDFVPETPVGHELTALTPFIRAYVVGAQTVIPEDTSGWGYRPPPLNSPFLYTNHSDGLSFDTFPDGTPPDDVVLWGDGVPAPFTDEQYQSAVATQKYNPGGAYGDIVVYDYGWRYTFTGPDAAAGDGVLETRRRFMGGR